MVRLLTFFSVATARFRLVLVSARREDDVLAFFFARLTAGAAVLRATLTDVRALLAAAAGLVARDFVAALPVAPVPRAFRFDAAPRIALSFALATEPTLRDTIFSEAAAFVCDAFTRTAAGRA